MDLMDSTSTLLESRCCGLMYDAVVVLGAGDNDITVGRVEKGIEMVKKGLAKVLVFVGGRIDGALAADLSKAHGLSNSQIYIDTNSKNTVDNAYYAKKILKELSAKKIALVTSEFHMNRSLAVFEWVLGDEFTIDPVPVKDNPDRRVLEAEKYKCVILIPVIRRFFAKGDAEGIKKAMDFIYDYIRNLL